VEAPRRVLSLEGRRTRGEEIRRESRTRRERAAAGGRARHYRTDGITQSRGLWPFDRITRPSGRAALGGGAHGGGEARLSGTLPVGLALRRCAPTQDRYSGDTRATTGASTATSDSKPGGAGADLDSADPGLSRPAASACAASQAWDALIGRGRPRTAPTDVRRDLARVRGADPRTRARRGRDARTQVMGARDRRRRRRGRCPPTSRVRGRGRKPRTRPEFVAGDFDSRGGRRCWPAPGRGSAVDRDPYSFPRSPSSSPTGAGNRGRPVLLPAKRTEAGLRSRPRHARKTLVDVTAGHLRLSGFAGVSSPTTSKAWAASRPRCSRRSAGQDRRPRRRRPREVDPDALARGDARRHVGSGVRPVDDRWRAVGRVAAKLGPTRSPTGVLGGEVRARRLPAYRTRPRTSRSCSNDSRCSRDQGVFLQPAAPSRRSGSTRSGWASGPRTPRGAGADLEPGGLARVGRIPRGMRPTQWTPGRTDVELTRANAGRARRSRGGGVARR